MDPFNLTVNRDKEGNVISLINTDSEGRLNSPHTKLEPTKLSTAALYYHANGTLKLELYAVHGKLHNYDDLPAISSYYPDGTNKSNIWFQNGNFVVSEKPNYEFNIKENSNIIRGWCMPFPEPNEDLIYKHNYENLDTILYGCIASGKPYKN